MTDGLFDIERADALILDGGTARGLVSSRDGDAALLYIYLISGGEYSRAGDELGLDEEALSSALDTLKRLGAVRAASDTPAASDELIAQAREQPMLKQLAKEAEKSLGYILTNTDLKKLFGLHTALGFDLEMILLLISFCLSENERKKSADADAPRRTTMGFVEKTGFEWARLGIYGLEGAEAHINAVDERRGARARIMEELQIQGRAMTRTESGYVEDWQELGFGPEAIELAYDTTVVNTGKRAWKYMDSILRSWHSKGLITPEQIAAEKAGGKSAPGVSSDADDGDVEWMRKFIAQAEK